MSIYPTDPNNVIPALHDLLQNGGGGGLDAVFVHFIIGTMYIVLPMLFLVLSSWAGLKISNAIMSAVTGMQAPASAAGQEDGTMARSALSKAARLIATAIK